jgi:hypothetical protein
MEIEEINVVTENLCMIYGCELCPHFLTSEDGTLSSAHMSVTEPTATLRSCIPFTIGICLIRQWSEE